MGISIFSSSTYDGPVTPNPDPTNFIINQTITIGKFVILGITYPDCTNFEGKKILVYKDVAASELMRQKTIDPHFSNSKVHHTPIARFKPDGEGLGFAIDFCKAREYR